jgi:PAS domain S-box-containing protein
MIIRDITERKLAEEKLRQSQELFSSAFHVSPAGITLTRIADGKIIDANESFIKMFEFSREEVIGHTSTELNMWTSEERKKLIQAQIASGGLQNFELMARSKSGRIVNLLFSSKPMEIGGDACHITTLIDISERKQAEEEIRLNRDRLTDLTRKLVETHEAAQRDIGRELHDQIGQMLTALKLTMELVPQLSYELAAKKMAQSRELVNDLLNRVSALSLELRPPMLDDLGLIPALTWHVNRFKDQTGIEMEFKHIGVEGKRFTTEIETTAYRAVQEALTNVARHAEATRTRLEIHVANNMLNIHIEDNGKGFDPQIEMTKHRSSGLSGMRERASLVGGTFQVESQPGKGTRKIIQLPLPKETL